jgi:hypothetical protein
MTSCEVCHRLEGTLHPSTDVVLYAANQAARVKGKKAREDAIAKVGQAQKERGEAGRLWTQHLESHEDKRKGPTYRWRLERTREAEESASNL